MSRVTTMRDAAQGSRAYSYSKHGRQNKGGIMGDHLIRNGAGVEVWKPSWKGTETIIRVYPALSPENPSIFDPWRFSAEDDDWGDWIRAYPAVRNFGDPGVTYILYDPADQTYDPQSNPAWLLFHAIDRAVKDGQGLRHWAPMLMNSQGRGAALKRPSDIWLIQCAMYTQNNKIYDPPRGGS